MSKFSELGLSDSIVKGIEALGFEEPTPIQAQIIPKILKEQSDVVGLAQTGTGKTAAFGLPAIDLVDPKLRQVQVLILSPTRELCVQIYNQLTSFSRYMDRINITSVYGGADIVKQIKDLRKGVQVVAATPGRLRDLIGRGAINLENVKYVILDEADEMLNMGFKEELDDILTSVPKERNTWLFSATMPDEVKRIANEYMNNPIEVIIGSKNEVNKDIDHQYVLTHRSIKYDVLRRFLDYSSDTFCLVFCRTRMNTRDLAEQLSADGYDADAIHGDLNQSQRDRVMAKFKNQHLKVLVATDVAARGIDVQNITHVFHYNMPDDFAFYTHRSGRTGRAGSKGVSLILAHPKEENSIRVMGKKLKIDITKAHIPTGMEICERRLMSFMEGANKAEMSEDAKVFMPKINEIFAETTKEEIIEKFAALSFNQFLNLYQGAADLNISSKRERGDRKERGNRNSSNSTMKRFFISVGSMDLENKGRLINLICTSAKIPGNLIGRIDFKDSFSFFDVDESVADTVLKSLEGESVNGRSIRINEDAARRNDGRKKDRHRRRDGGGNRGGSNSSSRSGGAKKDNYRRKKSTRR
jgi:ATP-dependent RNA helicase DeaD